MIVDLNERRLAAGRDPTPRVVRLDDHHLLHEVAVVLNGTLELREVLHRLAELTLDATGADRCSVFLLDEHLLEPAVAIGRAADGDLWGAFQAMGPVDLRTLPAAAERLLEGRLVVVEDATDSELLPDTWVQRFGPASLVLIPLVVADEPCGVLVVDHLEQRQFDEDELERLDAIGVYASVAVRNARLFDTTRRRARLQEAVGRGAAALAAPTEVTDLVSTVVGAYDDLPGVEGVAIALFDDAYSRITLVATTAPHAPATPVPVASVPAGVVEHLTRSWEDRPRAVGFRDEPWFDQLVLGSRQRRHHHLVLPLVIDRKVGGCVILAFADRPGHEERAAAKTLAAIAGATLERTSLLERLALSGRRFEALYALSTSLVEGADAAATVERLNGLLAGHGIEVVGMTFREPRLARLLGTPTPSKTDRAAMRRRPEDGAELLPDDSLAVQVRLGRKVVGLLKVRPVDLGEEERSFLETLGHGVAEVASRGALRAALDDAARHQAVADERDRIAADLHDTTGQVLVAIGLMARRAQEQLPKDSDWHGRFGRVADLADGGRWELEQSIRALAFVPASQQGLGPSLRDLTRSFASDSGLQILLDVSGEPVRLDGAVERALYRVAHEALANAWRHARCAVVRVELAFEDGAVALRVRDDGVGLPGPGGGRRAGRGLASMRRSIAEVEGDLRVGNGRPRGVTVEARVGVGRR